MHEKRSSGEKKLAWAVTIILGLLTLGLVQGASCLLRKCRPPEHENNTHKKIRDIFSRSSGDPVERGDDGGSSASDSEGSLHGLDDTESYVGQIGAVKVVCAGVFTAEAVAPSGEKIYFAIETIENSDKKKWDAYKNDASFLVNGGCADISIGSLVQLGSLVNDMDGLREFLTTRTLPDFWTSNEIQFEALCVKLRERNITADSPKAKDLSVIPYASNGINVEYQTHMVYVSKSPVIGRIDFIAQSKGFSGYVEDYGDLIMSVGVTISDVVENRGIFRNPLSVVEGGYAGIAMMAHSFTCMAVENNRPEVKLFKVRPLKKMGEIFLNSLPKDKVTVNGICGDIYDGGFKSEQEVLVPVKVLASLHRAANAPS